MSKETKQLIAETFVELSRQKSIDKVTVKDVVEACHVSRQTFYYHFQDLTDVMEWMLCQTTEQMLAECLKAENAEEALHIFVSTISNHTKGILPKLFESQRRAQLETMLLQAVRTYLQEMMKQRMPDLQVSFADLQVAIDFCSYGITGLLLEYGAKGTIDTEQLTAQIYRILNGGILQTVYAADTKNRI
ncbi:MAG: TetR/AcrR family transcriptional regulator C-terminal domain-containing protein [Peptococcaceae bacterium]|nr:TetR/AcrR family transcriptional regulator C-terminal domain-containing protein [Peptococcaceae bacterium]MBP3624475.1 TetR/AcrR family transcriptional regulator C-terminal domain-containing protein [Peptococcaceae bacterium]